MEEVRLVSTVADAPLVEIKDGGYVMGRLTLIYEDGHQDEINGVLLPGTVIH